MTGILATRTNQAKPTKEPAKKPIKPILHWRIQKKREYATPKNVWFGEWEPVREKSVPVLSTITLSTIPETAMLDADMVIAKKSIERKKHLRVVNVLKESVKTTTITKRILNLGVNFIVSELLASVLAVEKQLTKAISKDKAI